MNGLLGERQIGRVKEPRQKCSGSLSGRFERREIERGGGGDVLFLGLVELVGLSARLLWIC